MLVYDKNNDHIIGKFGEVYKAQLRRAITVTVKVTKEYSSKNSKAMRDFQNEMSIMSEVAHSNIVRLYGIVSEGEYDAVLHTSPTSIRGRIFMYNHPPLYICDKIYCLKVTLSAIALYLCFL